MISIRKPKFKRVKRNPGFNDVLKKLINTEVTVRINYPSELGYFSITGVLEYHRVPGNYRIETEDGKVNGHIWFSPNMMINYQNNIINISVKPPKHELDLYYNDEEWVINANNIASEAVRLKRECNIIISSDLFYQCMIFGRLNYNKKEKLYYIQSLNHLIQCRFYKNAIMNSSTTHHISDNYAPELSILLNDKLAK